MRAWWPWYSLAQAIVNAARARELTVAKVTGFEYSLAVGVTATVAGRTVRVGGAAMLKEENGSELSAAAEWRAEGAIILHVVVVDDGTVVGALRLADEIREESRQAVDALHAHGIEVVMVTGDAEAVARSVAGEFGIDRVVAEGRPEDKSAKVAEL